MRNTWLQVKLYKEEVDKEMQKMSAEKSENVSATICL